MDETRSLIGWDADFAPAIPLRELMPWLILGVASLGTLLFLVGLYQGSPLLHELLHDGRHLLGFPCH